MSGSDEKIVYSIQPSNRYSKDIKKLQKAGFDLSKLEKAVDILASGGKLPDKYKDHQLKHTLKGVRECHIAPDWLLLYAKDSDRLILLLVRTGTHRDALGIE